MKSWTLFPTLSAEMPLQMALDELLFRKAIASEIQQPLLRFYFSSEPWITTGYSDHGPFPHDAKVCRRITGGGRVHHGDDLVFSLIARKEDDESFKSVRVSYWKIHEAVKNGLEEMGEKPRFFRCDENLPRGGECFVYPIATDLAIGSHKIAGGAQKRSMGALLHQESIRIPKAMDAGIFIKKLEAAFESQFEMRLQDSLLDPSFLEAAQRLAGEKYNKPTVSKIEPLMSGV